MSVVTLRGKTSQLYGELPPINSKAPDFILVDSALRDKKLSDFKNKRKLLNIVPSLDTSVCATSTRRFNELYSGDDNIVMLMISADLPFAQKRFCDQENLKNIFPLSLMRSRKFAKDYGILILDGPLAGVTARAVIVLDETNMVVYAELVPEISQEPDYDAALAALKQGTSE